MGNLYFGRFGLFLERYKRTVKEDRRVAIARAYMWSGYVGACNYVRMIFGGDYDYNL